MTTKKIIKIGTPVDLKANGDFLKACREGVPCRMQTLAIAVGQPVEVISAIEAGIKRPSVELLKAICAALGIPKSVSLKKYYPSLF